MCHSASIAIFYLSTFVNFSKKISLTKFYLKLPKIKRSKLVRNRFSFGYNLVYVSPDLGFLMSQTSRFRSELHKYVGFFARYLDEHYFTVNRNQFVFILTFSSVTDKFVEPMFFSNIPHCVTMRLRSRINHLSR